MGLTVRNVTSGPAVDVVLNDIGITVHAGADRDLFDRMGLGAIISSSDLATSVAAGDLVILSSGGSPLTTPQSIAVLDQVEPPPTHADEHTTGSDVIDGDKLDITYTPTNYTPDAGVAEAGDADDLAAHLKGIDDQLPTPSSAIDDLTDVDTTTVAPAVNDKLIWDGSNWVPTTTTGNDSDNYAFAYDTTEQTIASISTFQDITYLVNASLAGWTHSAGTADFVCASTAKYAVTVEYNTEKNGGGNVECEIRALLEGVEVPGSHNGMDLTSNNTAFSLSRTFLVDVTAGETLKFQFAANNTSARIKTAPSPAGAATTISATLTIRKLT